MIEPFRGERGFNAHVPQTESVVEASSHIGKAADIPNQPQYNQNDITHDYLKRTGQEYPDDHANPLSHNSDTAPSFCGQSRPVNSAPKPQSKELGLHWSITENKANSR